MKVKTISEIHSARGTIPAGQIIEISETLLERLQGEVEVLPCIRPNGGRDLPHYCQSGDCWCSSKLPGSNYPTECICCEYHQASRDATQPANDQQGIQTTAQRRPTT